MKQNRSNSKYFNNKKKIDQKLLQKTHTQESNH